MTAEVIPFPKSKPAIGSAEHMKAFACRYKPEDMDFGLWLEIAAYALRAANEIKAKEKDAWYVDGRTQLARTYWTVQKLSWDCNAGEKPKT